MALTSRQRALAVIALGGTIGAISSLLAYGYVQQLLDDTRTELSASHQTISVAVATRALPWGTVLSDDAVRVVAFPSGSVPEGTFPSSDEVVGRVLVTPLTSQEPILASKLAPIDVTTGGVAAITHPEKRAMAIKVDDVTAVGGIVKPGDHVDVLTTISRVLSGGEPATKLVLDDVMVLSTGLDTSTAKHEEAVLGGQQTSRPSPTIVTLEVTPHEAERLSLAFMEGKVHLALRNPRSGAIGPTPGATVSSLFEGPTAEARARPARVTERHRTASQPTSVRHRPAAPMVRTNDEDLLRALRSESAADAVSVAGLPPRLPPYIRGQADAISDVDARDPASSTGPSVLVESVEREEQAKPDAAPPIDKRIAAPPTQAASNGTTTIHPPPVSVEVIRGTARTAVQF